MQCSVTVERDRHTGNNKMKTVKYLKNPYKKEPDLEVVVDQLYSQLQDIKDEEVVSLIGMPTSSIEQAEAVRRYYAAFPALKKGQESPLQYYLPPPAWCRKPTSDNKVKMQSELAILKDTKTKKNSSSKERRNSYHGQRRNNKKRHNNYSRSFESKESLPEWVTHEGVWDMETQDPVKEFIKAIALDEGYGTCENTVTDEIKEITEMKFRINENIVPDWDDSLDFDTKWVINEDLNPKVRTPTEEELYAKFEAKFNHSIEALWKDTPDDEYQELPIDFQDLLSSPSDHLFGNSSVEKYNLILNESIWSSKVIISAVPRANRANSTSKIVEVLHDRFKPLNLADVAEPEGPPRELESFSLYEGEDIYDALSSVAQTMQSFTAINHSRDRSGFVEVPPRRHAHPERFVPPPAALELKAPDSRRTPSREREDLLTSARTHFRPIRREAETEGGTRYADGDTFDIRGELDEVKFRRSESGGVYLESSLERYLEYRASKSIDYGRLKLTAAQRCPDLDDPGFRLRFPVRQTDAGVQTDPRPPDAWGSCEECGRSAKKMRPSAIDSIWSEAGACEACVPPSAPPAALAPPADELREWEELLSDISAAHAQYAGAGSGAGGSEALEEALVSADRKRRHSAALRCVAPCSHPHARFLHCAALTLATDRPLTR